MNAVLIARLDRLAAQVKAVVQTAAVLGREFEVAVLSRMLRAIDMPAIQEAEREAIWTALDQLHYLFRHALLRDAAYNMQAQERLKTLHQIAAETIEMLYPNDESQYDALLEHWQNTQVGEKILQYTAPVSKRLITIDADFRSAERLLEAALALGDTPLRPMLLRFRGDAAEHLGDYPTAIAHYESCLNIANGDIVQQVAALDGLAQIYLSSGDHPKTVVTCEQALALAREHQDQAGIASTLAILGVIAHERGDYLVARFSTIRKVCVSIKR